MLRSFVYAWRSWQHSKNVALLAVVALAAGIGSTTAIYSVVHAVLLNPLGYPNADRYLSVSATWRFLPHAYSAFGYYEMQELSARQRTLDSFGCAPYSGKSDFNVTLGGQSFHAPGQLVTAAFLRSLGVNPVLGRWFDGQDRHQAVISESLWRRGGSDPAIAGKSLVINGAPYTITGVVPGWFRFPVNHPETEIWAPLIPTRGELANHESHYLLCFAKMKPGISATQAGADLRRIAADLEHKHPDTNANRSVAVEPLLNDIVAQVRPALLLLLGAAGALLLITCANVASLLLARSVSRARETAVRVALGATLRQLMAGYFAEGLLVALAGAALGAALSVAMVRTVLAIGSQFIPRADQIRLNVPVLGFALLIALVCAVLCSLAPLWQAVAIAPHEVLSDGTRASSGGRSRGLLRVFVIAEIALAFALLATAASLLARVGNLSRIDPGFNPHHLLTFNMFAPDQKFESSEKLAQFQQRMLTALQGVPGVEAAGFSSTFPLTFCCEDAILQAGPHRAFEISRLSGLMNFDFELRPVSPGYLEAMKTPLLAGRTLTESDGRDVDVIPIVISRKAAQVVWPHGPALGQLASISSSPKVFRVVGVVADVRDVSLTKPARGDIYLHYRLDPRENMRWALRSGLARSTLVPAFREAARGVDPAEPIFDVRPMEEIVRGSLSLERLQSVMVGFFALAALLLAMLGVYGVVSYSVRQRIPEMGTRMALGATGNGLLRLVLIDGFKMAAIGLALGGGLVLALFFFLNKQDLGLQNAGYGAPLYAAACVAICALAACWFPGWRATSLSPMVAIRSQPDAMWEAAQSRAWHPTASLPLPETAAAESALLSEISEASRAAESFDEAIERALATLQNRLQSQSSRLFVQRAPGEPFVASGESLPADSLLVQRLRHYHVALPFSPGDLEALEAWAREHAPARLSETQTLRRLAPALIAPVFSRETVSAMLLLGAPLARAEYSSFEKRLLMSAAALLGLMLENSRLTGRIVEHERLRRELLLASEVQKRLFPEQPPPASRIQLAGFCLPARGVGGDYYDFLPLENGQTGIALADVAGKGIAAALVMSVVQASLRSLTDGGTLSLAELAAKINGLLHRSTGPSSYATFFYAQCDEANLELRYVNAGHNPPFLLRHGPNGAGGRIEELSAGGTIIGMFPNLPYEETTLQLCPGDTLLLFTDGVSEAHDPRQEEYGDERLKDLLRRTARLPIQEMSNQVIAELRTWMQDAPQHDDLTFVLMKVV